MSKNSTSQTDNTDAKDLPVSGSKTSPCSLRDEFRKSLRSLTGVAFLLADTNTHYIAWLEEKISRQNVSAYRESNDRGC